jgi:Na+-transporting methylmalonyl-CoA/oxaloacetate decarboxylase beta subunit
MLCLLFLLPHAALACWHLYDQLVVAPELGVIGGADGPTSIYLTAILAPELLGPTGPPSL